MTKFGAYRDFSYNCKYRNQIISTKKFQIETDFKTKIFMESDSLVSTDRLFHYTWNKENLLSILENGFKPKYSLEKLGLFKEKEIFKHILSFMGDFSKQEDINDEFAIPMICFCDIPLDLVENHIKMYGKYSIGLSKEWGVKQGICPVFYVPERGETRNILESMIRFAHNQLPIIYEKIKQNKIEVIDDIELFAYFNKLIQFSMYIKPYISVYERKQPKIRIENYKFYDEREWRYKPSGFLPCEEFLTKVECENDKSRDDYNAKLRHLNFDIADIIVPEDEIDIIRKKVSKIKRFKNFDLNKINSLKNKIINNSIDT